MLVSNLCCLNSSLPGYDVTISQTLLKLLVLSSPEGVVFRLGKEFNPQQVDS